MQWLPKDVADALQRHVNVLAAGGFTTARLELVCALILSCDITDPLLDDLRLYKSRYSLALPSRRRARGVPLMLRVPSPITHRLDCLVKAICERSQRVYRHEVIGALILRAEEDYQRLEEDCLTFRKAAARDAAVRWEPLRVVLSQEKPRPGARSG